MIKFVIFLIIIVIIAEDYIIIDLEFINFKFNFTFLFFRKHLSLIINLVIIDLIIIIFRTTLMASTI